MSLSCPIPGTYQHNRQRTYINYMIVKKLKCRDTELEIKQRKIHKRDISIR